MHERIDGMGNWRWERGGDVSTHSLTHLSFRSALLAQEHKTDCTAERFSV